jgi:2-oxoacid:acceptor oxidoreductase delta subunit (pyruvate/2-ketoisovalerate family)
MSMRGKKMIEPPMAVSTLSTAINRTGTWRYAKPVFLERVAPCNEACPAGEDIDRVMLLNSQERFLEAYQKIKEENPFPGICGRVCLHPCEGACNRRFFDEAVSIRGLERFVGDWARERDVVPEITSKKSDKKIAVIGSGPAGLSCAYFSALLGHDITLFEKEASPGGMLRRAIPEYRIPPDVLHWELEQVFSLGVKLRVNTSIGRDLSMDDLHDFDAVFLAPGASRSEMIHEVKEPAQEIYKALEFLRQSNEGNPPVLTGGVIVVGGGNTAIDAARVALRLGGEPMILYRRSREEMPAAEEEVAQAEKEGVVFRYLTGVSGIIEESGHVKTVLCTKMKLVERDENGRRGVQPLEGASFTVKADHVILAIGQKSDLSFVPTRIHTEKGFITVGHFLETGTKGFFAGGDAVDQPRTVVHAIASGKRGAMAIDLYMRKEPFDLLGRVAMGNKKALSMKTYQNSSECSQGRLMNDVVPYEALNLHHFRKSPRFHLPTMPAKQAIKGFKEVEGGFNRRQAVRSAKRCFNCGICSFCLNCYEFCPDLAIHLDDRKGEREIDYDHCKGCGICVEECPRAAMGMVQE